MYCWWNDLLAVARYNRALRLLRRAAELGADAQRMTATAARLKAKAEAWWARGPPGPDPEA
jgi:hypothetical protein